MWKCKHCEKEFDFEKTSDKANHSRWCDKNPKRNDTSGLIKAQEKVNERKLGKFKNFNVKCYTCKTEITVTEREKQFPKKEKYYCNKSCANSQGGKAKALLDETNGNMKYRTLAEKYHKKECVVCKFDKIVEVHHVNEIHEDNRPENLVWLCPNHHQMYHSRYKNEIKPYIDRYLGN